MLLHATSVAIKGEGVLLAGSSGIGKSDLALRLLDAGALLVSDDQTKLFVEEGSLFATSPSTIQGLLEVRHVGVFHVPFQERVKISLYVDLVKQDEPLERLPETETIFLLDRSVRRLRLKPCEASTLDKIKAALFMKQENL